MTLKAVAPAPTTIVFGTDGWRARIADEFTFENVRRCADGVARYIVDRGETGKGVERLMPAFDEVRKAVAESGDDVHALIAGFVRGMCETIERHPWLPALWVREVLCDGGALREILMSTVAPQIPQVLAGRFAAAQDRGELNPDLDPRLLVTSLVGLTLFPAAGAPISSSSSFSVP